LALCNQARWRNQKVVNPLECAKEEHERIHEAVKTFAKAIGCDMSEEGGKQFARIIMVAVAEAAFEGGDIFEGVAKKLLVFRPQPPRNSIAS
jgi:hypothetical protein